MSWEENVRKVVPYTPGEQPNKAHTVSYTHLTLPTNSRV